MLLNWVILRKDIVTGGNAPVIIKAEHTCGYDHAWALNHKEPEVTRTRTGRKHKSAYYTFINLHCGMDVNCPAQMLIKEWSPILSELAQIARDW
jgi:hypothetical protein